MIKRRTILKSGLSLPLLPTISGCSNSDNATNDFYREGIYLSGNFAPVEVETTETQLKVTGTIPEELSGRFLRNGPNPLGKVNVSSHHWFIGDGMVHGVRLDAGRADWYRNRWPNGSSWIPAVT